jgi:hypothetical protein
MQKSNGRSKARKPSVRSLVRYLPCRVRPGMFKGELLVFLDGLSEAREPISVQMLVDELEVEGLDREPGPGEPAHGWVRVALAREHKGVAEVILPQPAQPVGDSLLVDRGQLKAKVGS